MLRIRMNQHTNYEHEAVDVEKHNNSKAFIEYKDDMYGICENIEEHKPDEERE